MDVVCDLCTSKPAQVTCSCSHSQLCVDCIPPHYLSFPSVSHTITSINTPEMCTECNEVPAVFLCCCVPSLKKLCTECRAVHKRECSDGSELPIDALAGCDPYEFHTKQRFLLTLANEVEKARIDLAQKEREIDRFYTEVVTKANEFRERDRLHFERMRAITEHHFASILDRISALRTSSTEPALHIVDELLANKDTLQSEEIANALKLYNIDIEPYECMKKLEFAIEIHYENAGSPPEALYFFLPGSNIAAVYDVQKGHKRFVKGTFPLVFKQDASWCILPNDTVFYCGGFDGSYSKDAMIVSLNFKNGSMLPPMLFTRKWAGLAYHEGLVYVFGGCSGPWLKKCEKFSLSDKSWESIAEMNEGRAVSGPTYWKRKFLLCGYNSIRIEIFDIDSGSFFTVPQMLTNTQDVLSFVHSDVIVFLQKDKMMKLNLESNVEMEVMNIGNLNQTYTRVSPVKVGSLYYYVDDRGRVWSINVESQIATVEEVLTL